MPQNEQTNKRPSNYSTWHRYPTLPRDCYQVDADWFEMRRNNGGLLPVAGIETMEIGALFIADAQKQYPLWDAKRALYCYLNEKLGIPFFIVRHTADCKLFSTARLTRQGQETEANVMTEDEYKTLLANLSS